ncbi:MAG: VOC family protein [Dehalococcoidales bacterium]|jgi:uncharacterized glyoxalase superfamily protein PhnB
MGYISPNLSVKDMKKTLDFYTRKLGFMPGMTFPNPDNPVYADASKDGIVFMFTPADGAKGKMGVGVNLYLQIDGDIDSYYADLKKRGAKISADIKNEPFGIRDFSVEDPDGYKLTFNAPVKAPGGGGEAEGKCQSCGMPLTSAGHGDNPYCMNCCHPDGSLKTYEEVLDGMITYMMTNQKLDRAAAGKAAREYLSIMPAWCNQ